MLRKLFSRRRASSPTPEGSIPDGQRIYAIGDIHGRLDLLDSLLMQIESDNSGRPAAETVLIFLGDLIDRGPQSAQVVERLMQIHAAKPHVRLLLGNHEEVFLLALSGDIEALRFFVRIGGKETIFSYGIEPAHYDAYDFEELMAVLRARVPDEHIRFLQDFEDMIEIGDYLFVHAGVRPATPLSEQRTKDLRWIRSEFLEHADPLERIVIHGHTISEGVDWRSNRIGIDTGAYAGGQLTALALEGNSRWLLQTGDA